MRKIIEALLLTARINGHTFVPSLLNAKSVVIDLGAGDGGFCGGMHNRFGCTCFAVEPTPAQFARLCAMPGIRAYKYAASDRDDHVPFLVMGKNRQAIKSLTTEKPNGSTIMVTSRSLQSMLAEFHTATVNLLKIDIKGAEISILLNTPEDIFRRIEQITVEFHNLAGVITDTQVQTVVARLRRLGFYALNWGGLSAGSTFLRHPRAAARDNLDLLFVRRDIKRLHWMKISYIRFFSLALKRCHYSILVPLWKIGAGLRKGTD